MILVYGRDVEVAAWVAAQIPHMPTGFIDMKAIGVADAAGALIGGAVYHEFRGNDIQISCAAVSRRWLNKRFIKAMFVYPFIQLGCDRVTSCIPSRNAHTRRFIEGLGFKEEGSMRRGFIGDDCIIYGMLREECKYIKD